MKLQHECIEDALGALAKDRPAAPALQAPGRKPLTYADLAAQIHRVRKYLGGLDIGRGDIVAGVIPSRPEMAVACATLPASSTFAPLSPSLTPDDYSQLLVRTGAKAILAPKGEEHPVRAAARRHGVAEIDVAVEPDAPAGLFTLDLGRAGDSLRNPTPARPQLAYVLVSSGTTGRPKLIPSQHRQTLRYANVVGKWLEYSPRDVGCHLMPMHLGNGLRSGWLNPLLNGVSTVCLPEVDVDAFFAALEQYRPTCLNAGFTLLSAILRRVPDYRPAVAQSRLRFLRAGLGRLDSDEIERLEQGFSAPLLGALSSTETTSIAHDPLPPRPRKRGTAGLPLGNEVGIMDSSGAIAGARAEGEIVVRGPLVFGGYLDDPQLTAESFVGDWFRTGDLGHIDEGGYIHLSGRIKEIINRGGEKISPVEIDLAIRSLPGVNEAAAFGIPHPTLGEEIVAAVVRQPDVTLHEAQVIQHVGRRLELRKVPRRIYFVERLPRTDNGKLRRHALPQLLGLTQKAAAQGAPLPAAEEIRSLSPLEGALAGLWATLLKIEHVNPDDNFFLLGGDSLRGVQLIAQVKALFGVELAIQSLFEEGATVVGMARSIEAIRNAETKAPIGARSAAGQAADAAIPRRQSREPSILSHTQRRAWFLARLDPSNPAYNERRAHRLTGTIDVDALRGSLQAVLRRHEILRTTYVLVDDEPRQVVREHATLDLRRFDLSYMAALKRDDALADILTIEAQQPFDLETGPLARFSLIRLGDDDHVLMRVWHHIVSDGWSAGLFERELSILYNALVAGRAAELPALALQYADYAVWQRQWLAGEVLDKQLGYWKGKLANLSTLELPTDRTRPAVQSNRGARLESVLPQSLAEAVEALGHVAGTTPFMTLLAAFQVLLHRYSGAEDIVVGTPIAGRRRAELEGLIGFFANTVVLRVSLAGAPTFRELLARVRESALAAYTHQDLPFEKLVGELAPSRDLSRNPLFQVCFALQNTPDTVLALEGLQASRLALPTRHAKFDLTLTLSARASGLQASWEYCTDLFERATIERMAGHFQRLLESIVADPGQRIGQFALLDAADRHRLLVEWNNTAADYPREACLHTLFETRVAKAPQAVAVAHGGNTLTYAELNAHANRLAHRLRAHGVGPQALVGICMERSLDLIVGLLGILKAGGAYVPLDPNVPRERLALMLDDAHVAVVLTHAHLRPQLPAGPILICLDTDWFEIAAEPDYEPASVTTPDNLIYVIYTSGSSGVPKGVLVSHRSLVNYTQCFNAELQIGPRDRVLQFASVAFDVSAEEVFGALTAGATLVLRDQQMPRSGSAFLQTCERLGITVLDLPTAFWHELVNGFTPRALQLPQSVRAVIIGGERALPELTRRWLREVGPTVRTVNMYGPTEATVAATCYDLTNATGDWTEVPIGRPMANVQIYILDAYLQPVPVGVPGELHVGGVGVAKGYLNRPDLTAQKFIPHPFSDDPQARLYKTGDWARYLPDGNIQFLGRVDAQVKLRGFRIEPAEITSALDSYPAVRASHVMAWRQASGDVALGAYVVPRHADRDPPTAAELRRFLSSRLPTYMVPVWFVAVESIPLTSNGKVDLHALPDPSVHGVRESGEYVAPRDETERVMCRVWAEVLGIGRVGLDDNFFEIGGHSLLAARLFARLDKEFGRSLPLGVLFAAPTVRVLAESYRVSSAPQGYSTLVALTTSGSLPAIYAVPGVFGNVIGFAELSRELGLAQPFYGLQSLGLDGMATPLDSIDVMARRYASEIQTIQPHGPYILVGACFGATVAYEMARQLLAAGEEVAFLGLLDPARRMTSEASKNPTSTPRLLKRALALGSFVKDRLTLYLEEMRGRGYGDRVTYIARKLGSLGRLLEKDDALEGVQREINQLEVYRANFLALDRYRRKPLSGRLRAVEIFETIRRGSRREGEPSEWGALWEGKVIHHRVLGIDSGDMLIGANARVLAALVAERLRVAREGSA